MKMHTNTNKQSNFRGYLFLIECEVLKNYFLSDEINLYPFV